MSATLKNVYAPVPSTTRGKPIHVGGDPKGANWLYTCGSAVVIRNLQNPLQAELYTEHRHPTTVARYAPSGFYIASGDVSGAVRIWDTVNKEHVLKIELNVLSGAILDIQWSDDSKRLVVCGDGKERFGAVLMFDSGSSVGEISGHAKSICSCDWRQTRPYRVATGSEDLLVNWFEGPPFKFKKSMKEHTRFVNCVRFSPDGSRLIAVSSDKLGFLYDGKSGDLVGQLSTEPGQAHTAGIYSCAWKADSQQLLTASADRTCRTWSRDGAWLQTFTMPGGDRVELQQLGCLWQADQMLSIALSGFVSYLDADRPDVPRRVVRGHNKAVTALAIDVSRGTIYSGSYDALMLEWRLDSAETAAFDSTGHTNQINRAVVQPVADAAADHSALLVTASMDDTVRLTPIGRHGASGAGLDYDAVGSSVVKLESAAVDVAVSRRCALVLAVVTDGVCVLRSGRLVAKRPLPYQPTTIALSVDETQVAVGGRDNKVHVYQLADDDSLVPVTELTAHRGPVTRVAYSPDGQWLASADHNRDIFVWDIGSSWALKHQGWVFHTAAVRDLAWSPSSLHLASAGLDGALYVWSLEQPSKRIFIKDAHSGGVNVCVFVDSSTLLSAGQDCAIKSWQLQL
eukprot:TRINITY_DN11092_c0_g1_i1.p1 TRINITY_DN11092_c0_g1~~TRINITY_DN11092_c0_g1_i1.p1  ORF type:complete len:626 (+),score=263.95 TRINITY_DN11092_c0_g1_i1:95-1972(+)